MENIQEDEFESTANTFLPKPELIEDKQKLLRKSLINLAIYIFIFLVVLQIELVYGAALLIVLLIHELGHFFAMKLFKFSQPNLFTLPLLASLVSKKENNTISQTKMSLIILAGPAPGIIIGLLLLLTHDYYPNERLEMLGNIFVGLNLFNLLPFMPLDGGRILEVLFVKQSHIIRLVFTIISIVFILLMAIYFRNIFFLIIPATMIFELISEVKNQRIREYLLQENINYTTEYKDLSNENYWLIRDCILLSFNKRYSMVQAGVHQYTIIEGSIMQHVISILRTPITNELKLVGKILMFLLFIGFIIAPILYYIPKAIELANSMSLPK